MMSGMHAPGLPTPTQLAAMIDHTLLRADATAPEIEATCDEALAYGFHAVCIAPCFVRTAVRRLSSAATRVCTVIGFPHGTSRVKAHEARVAVDDGAQELDMVLQLGSLIADDLPRVRDDIRSVVKAAPDAVIKVIIESAGLGMRHLDAACQACCDAGADFVKTSTGFGPGGATTWAVARMRSQVGSRLRIKASGGIRDLDTALAMIDAGADRLGTSASVAIIDALQRRRDLL